MNKLNAEVGDRIKFKNAKQSFLIRACDERFIIATKPFNAKNTFFYTIVDLQENCRGGDNWYCKYDYENDDLTECLELLHKGEIYSTHRSRIDLDFEKIIKAKRTRNTDNND